MTRGLSARMIHLTDQALAALHKVTWLSTSEVIAAIGLTPADSQAVWRALNWLARNGFIERIHVADSRAVYWRRTFSPAGTGHSVQPNDERGGT